MKKIYLITGASGYIGSHLAEFLLEKKKSCVLFDKKKSELFKKNKLILGDIYDEVKLDKITKNIDIVFHFAATADLHEANEKPFETIENNLSSTLKLIKASGEKLIAFISFSFEPISIFIPE